MGIRSNFEKNWSESGKYHHRAVPRSAVPGSAAGTVFGVAVCHADSGEQYVSEGSGTRYGGSACIVPDTFEMWDEW